LVRGDAQDAHRTMQALIRHASHDAGMPQGVPGGTAAENPR
jgi:hypothetical protein